ncbi:related to meiosis-specific APC/C activator protein AMA1 [Rhynchosporium graminicola]|uniref:Related to meiosis-specific APC/C activator protein AMA1 n=1 Tax=Rhynchosporium graminicola TaxID=2792576 RepID=A0A1E1LI16_9HELO|nr:related to meiosis-specific APC/C activator protein AMA1 [Rhynchosporium commune]
MTAPKGSITCRKRYSKSDLPSGLLDYWSGKSGADIRPFYDAVRHHFDIPYLGTSSTEFDSPEQAPSATRHFDLPYRSPSSVHLDQPKREPSVPSVTRLRISSGISQFDGPSDSEKRALAIATLPRINPRTNTFRRRPSLKAFTSSGSSGSLRAPDRFLQRRQGLDSAVESFRASRDPRTLTTDEKLLRHKDASPDAFNPRRRATTPIPNAIRPPTRRNFSGNRSGSGGGSVLTFQRDPAAPNGERQVSVGTIWRVGGLAPVSGVPDGRGGLIGSGTNAPLYTTSFTARPRAQEDKERHENRLAEALDLDRVGRVFEFRDPTTSPLKLSAEDNGAYCGKESRTSWLGTEWVLGGPDRILDAPNLRDDFYCSVLAYSKTCHTLAVGLGSMLYAWSEMQGVHLLNGGTTNGSWLTSLAFSSTQGKKSILAFGKSDGSLNLVSLYDSMLPRFEVQHPSPIACLTWRPQVTMRLSRCPLTPSISVQTEDLLVGDEIGNVYYYSVEWPQSWEVTRNGWSGSMTLLVKISVHSQQICGLSFSCDGSLLATGGNDNLCCLFRTNDVLHKTREESQVLEETFTGGEGTRRIHTLVARPDVKAIKLGAEKHRWVHGAAVKAIAFCPWRDGLVATGGGSNDKCIHFFHTTSGTCLATISVAAQVTSLIWSTTRREIVATFGYAQPEHPYRIAVFSWPECKQVAAIPWEGEHRALYAIPYPGGPNESQSQTSREGVRGLSRTATEGCIVVASSDESVKFHEVWAAGQKATVGGEGLLGGSDILEGLEGIDKEGDVIR